MTTTISTTLDRRTLLAAGTAALGASLLPAAASAQAWPSKPIRWVVPYTGGGLTDITTRVTLEKMAGLGTVVVENKPGANSLIGADMVAKAAPDGHTFLTVIAAHAANKTLYAGKTPFDPVASFAPVSLVGIAPLILTVTDGLPVKNVAELIDYAKKNPGKLSYGSSGVGAAAHLTTELFKQTVGVDMVHAPYRGTAPALADLMGGNIQVLVDAPSGVMSQVRAGKIRALCMFSKERVPGAEGVPTIVEAGGPLIESSTWVMFLAPAGTPKDIVEKVSAMVAQATATPELKKRLADLAIIAVGSTPAAAAKFLDEEIAKWGAVITKAGVKMEG